MKTLSSNTTNPPPPRVGCGGGKTCFSSYINNILIAKSSRLFFHFLLLTFCLFACSRLNVCLVPWRITWSKHLLELHWGGTAIIFSSCLASQEPFHQPCKLWPDFCTRLFQPRANKDKEKIYIFSNQSIARYDSLLNSCIKNFRGRFDLTIVKAYSSEKYKYFLLKIWSQIAKKGLFCLI